MKLTVTVGLILFVCLLCFLRRIMPNFRITFFRLVLICALSVILAFFSWKLLVTVGVVLLAVAVTYLIFKINAK